MDNLDYNYKLIMKSKDEYLQCLSILQDLNIPLKATGDDWNCEFEILVSVMYIPLKITERVLNPNRYHVYLERLLN